MSLDCPFCGAEEALLVDHEVLATIGDEQRSAGFYYICPACRREMIIRLVKQAPQ